MLFDRTLVLFVEEEEEEDEEESTPLALLRQHSLETVS